MLETSASRRALLGGSVLVLAGSVLPRRAQAQKAEFPSLTVGSIAELVRNQMKLREIAADVAFIHSWRVELKPLGDEGGDFVNATAANRGRVFTMAGSREGPALVDKNAGYLGPVLGPLRQRLTDAFKKNSDAYSGFLKKIGIDPNGAAATRLSVSSYLYANVNHAMLGSEGAVAEKNTFIWPVCIKS